MKKALILTTGLLVGFGFTSKAFATKLETIEQKASYTLASDIAQNLKSQGLEIDIDAFTQGLTDVFENNPSKMTEQEKAQAIKAIKQKVMAKQLANHAKASKENFEESKKFFAENAKKPGVKTLENGIQYRVIKAGKGNSPTATDNIVAHYEGRLIDGTVFDSSYNRGTPFEFQMGNVIKGWGEALKMMKPGDKWEVTIPSELAYGQRGAGDRIGPNQALIFIIELVSFSK